MDVQHACPAQFRLGVLDRADEWQAAHLARIVHAIADQIARRRVIGPDVEAFRHRLGLAREHVKTKPADKDGRHFYIDLLVHQVRTGQYERADWGQIWREVKGVTPAEWQASQAALRESYDRLKQLIADTTEWPDERHVGGAIMPIVHTAYHLGEIRQALCTLKP